MRTALLFSSASLLFVTACAEAPEPGERQQGQAPTLSEVMDPDGFNPSGNNEIDIPGLPVSSDESEEVEASMEETTTTEDTPMLENFSAAGSVVGGEGDTIGEVQVNGGPHGIVLRVTLNEGALTPGWHGLHLHQVGDCSDIGEFKLSGGHVGKIEGGHGFMNPEGPEGGDLPNIWVADNGSAGYEAFTTLTTGEDLLDEDASALIIHEMSDDFITQPIGGAGARVACAVIN
ncbi:MAG: superoxide dismutase [Ponticaulis sp.]|nr:superoxide dismutase [Ponticaulis sp.]|tara:strand:+ start:211657 stop:212352 length:696 start_codon:yes stop_codon:yes gene_type:complete